MYYDEKKGRHVIDGESSSEDEPPPPPPKPGNKQPVAPAEEKKEEDKSGANALMQAPVNPNLNRRVGRPGGRPRP